MMQYLKVSVGNPNPNLIPNLNIPTVSPLLTQLFWFLLKVFPSLPKQNVDNQPPAQNRHWSLSGLPHLLSSPLRFPLFVYNFGFFWL